MARKQSSTSPDVYVLELDGMQQSAVDLSDPTRLSFDYMRRIAALIDALPGGRLPQERLAVLHVGGAAMNLPRYVHVRRPGSSQIVLEPNAQVVEQVRAEAPLPPRSGIKVRTVDGATGIGTVREDSLDLVVLDAFDGAQVPVDLTGAEFLGHVVRVLAPGGVFVANLTDRAPFTLVRDVVAGLEALSSTVDGWAPRIAVGAETSTFKAKRPGNVLVAAGALPDEPFGRFSPGEYRVLTGTAVRDSFGGGRPRP
ncbi:spermidine synthase [Nocardioides yefusunii]|uniref:Spermidine synthase n=1 Tax=Nocardioides yefusunii TaxID=2500546 RepID=A0ABW1R0I1_9ACTN|nr:fused MFS/spermidine synthase [Nocardioides yefusunii]